MALIAGTSEPGGIPSAEANFFFVHTIEEAAKFADGKAIKAGVKVFSWGELDCFEKVQSTLTAIGFDLTAEEHWQLLGVDKESAPSEDGLEARRRVAKAALSAAAAFGWPHEQIMMAKTVENKIEEALICCHRELPEIKRRLKKKKAGKGLVPLWVEPSPCLLEFVLAQHPGLSIALNLSNIQRVPLNDLQDAVVGSHGCPRVLRMPEARELYTALAQSQEKIEHVLRRFQDGGCCCGLWKMEPKSTGS